MESTNEPNARRLFRNLREDLGLRRTEHLAGALPVLSADLRDDLETELERVIDGASFFQRENPFVRHVVLRKRATLEAQGLLDKIAVNVHPEAGLVEDPHRFNALFQADGAAHHAGLRPGLPGGTRLRGACSPSAARAGAS